MYAKGIGIGQDYVQAKEWLEKAAAQGSDQAQLMLATFYFNGDGVKKNAFKAKEWYGQACDNGSQEGCDAYKKLNEAG